MMHQMIESRTLLHEINQGRRYSNSLLSVARDFWCVPIHAHILEMADSLQNMDHVRA